MLRGWIAGALAVAVVGTASGVWAQTAVQIDKCQDLQTRCLHHEAVVCKVWQSECLHPHQSGGASHKGNHGGFRLGRKHHAA